ncbi:MAG: hypothetical protein WD273_00235 [Trueperaceae bacterium]
MLQGFEQPALTEGELARAAVGGEVKGQLIGGDVGYPATLEPSLEDGALASDPLSHLVRARSGGILVPIVENHRSPRELVTGRPHRRKMAR